MTQPVSRAIVEAFFEAYGGGDFDRTAAFLADDVEWTINGPVDVLTFCGTRRGKAAVLDIMARGVPAVLDVIKSEPNVILIEGERVATLNRLWAKHIGDGRMISYRLAHFLRFRDGKIVENLSLLDSFDAVEQVLGHPLATHEPLLPDDDLIAV